MIDAEQAREISSLAKKQSDWYHSASKALRDAMEEIEIAARYGDTSVRVVGMTEDAAKALSSYGFSLQQKSIKPQWVEKNDGSSLFVKECTEISW